MVHPAIGVRPEQIVRVDIPADILHLQKMWVQVLRNLDEMTTPSASSCLVCKHFDDDALDASDSCVYLWLLLVFVSR